MSGFRDFIQASNMLGGWGFRVDESSVKRQPVEPLNSTSGLPADFVVRVFRKPTGFVRPTHRNLGNDVWDMNAAKVLVVDDEENISFLVASALRMSGMEVETADNGSSALSLADSFRPDVLVLDIMLGDVDGLDVLRILRSRGHTAPVLFLTAKTSTADRVKGLTAGGDDYITKPFALEELVARVQVALRRTGLTDSSAILAAGAVELDDDAHLVTKGGEVVHLTPTEYKLCRLLLTNAGRVVSRAQILDHVWEYDFDGESAIVETFISSLRKKLHDSEQQLIETVRGVGYTIRRRS